MIGTVRGPLIEAGIVVSTECVSGVHADTGKKTGNKGTPIVRFDGIFDVFFRNADDESQFIKCRVPGSAEDTGDKAPGKASTYGQKGAIKYLIMLETGEAEESRLQDQEPGLDPIPEDARKIFTDGFKAAPTKDALIALLEAARAEAKKFGDGEAYKLFTDAATEQARARFQNPVVALPTAAQKTTAAAPADDAPATEAGAEPPATASAPATTVADGPKLAPSPIRGKPASAGLVKMLVTAVGDRVNTHASILKGMGVGALTELDAMEVKSTLAYLMARDAAKAAQQAAA